MNPKLPAPVPPLDLSRVKALLFDVDGTLSDSDDQLIQRLVNLLKPARFIIPEPKARSLSRRLVMRLESPGNTLLGLADRLQIDNLIAKVLDQRARRRAPHASYPVIPGVPQMLQTLSLRYPLVVVSARNALTTHAFLEHNALEPYFAVVVTSQTCPHTKPYPDPLIYAAHALGVPIQDCLMIGDTVVDVRAARAAGAQSLSVLCGFGTEKELRAAGTQAILPSTADLADFLE
ncbi:MAG: phosphoglycolate phosphatase [Anaerolineaceae bacterium]